MGVNKVMFGAAPIMDISDSTVTPDKLSKGATAYDKTGEKITGTHVCKTLADLTANADATAADIALGKSAYVKGVRIVGTAQPGAVEQEYAIYNETFVGDEFFPVHSAKAGAQVLIKTSDYEPTGVISIMSDYSGNNGYVPFTQNARGIFFIMPDMDVYVYEE